MQRFLLIRPGLTDSLDVTPPLGLLYLAAVLRRERRAEVRVLDLMARSMSEDEVVRAARGFDPDAVGLSALSCQAASMQGLARKLRAALPRAVLIAGGAYASSQPKSALAQGHLDYCVVGEGERTLLDLVAALDRGDDPAQVRGIAFLRDGRFVETGAPAPIEDLDALPFPAFDLADFDAYARQPRIGMVYGRKRYFSLFTSRGCPYQCIYCHKVFGKRFRPRGAENVLNEIEVLYRDHAVREIQFIDDVINLQKERLISICRGIVEHGLDLAVSFPGGLRADLIDEELADWMKLAGAYRVSVAVETAAPRVQAVIRKNLDPEKARRSIAILAERGIMVNGFFMMGFPTETAGEMETTAKFAARSRLHTASFYFVLPFPGSDLHARLAGQRGGESSDLVPSSFYDPSMSRISLCDASPEELRRAVRRAYVRFYANPVRLARILRDIPNKRQLIRLTGLALTRIFFPAFEKRWLGDRRKPAPASAKN